MKHHEKIVPIILAAGRSKRLPVPKALAEFGGRTALAIAVENCVGLETPIVVLGCHARRVRRAVPEEARAILNRHWRKGQLSSLQSALRRVPAKSAFLIYPVDQPLLRKETVRKLVRAFRARKSSQQIVMPRYKRTDGHPVIISSAMRKEFFQAKTAREVVYRRLERIRIVRVDTASVYEDFNSPESYRLCLKKFLAQEKRCGAPSNSPPLEFA
jgi:CTP:molybdopterin cytidylyltransferase MocA